MKLFASLFLLIALVASVGCHHRHRYYHNHRDHDQQHEHDRDHN